MIRTEEQEEKNPVIKTTRINEENTEQSSYRQIFKATSLFGGVQVFNILIGIVRVKFVAVLLGTTGVGILKLFNAPLELIISITGLGIAYSAVRDVSEARGSGNQKKVDIAITTLRRWSWFTGLLGAVITLSFAPLLSQWSFGSKDYTWGFVWLSVTLLLRTISKGQTALLQGMRRLKDLAKAGVLGTSLGLITSIPLYYWFGVEGIVPALIITAVITIFLSWYFARKVKVERVDLTIKETYKAGMGMAKLGISMTIAGFLASFSSYVLNAFISHQGGVDQVGLYNAGWGVVGQYTSLVFTAMATDYFPRLSAIQHDNIKVKDLVRQQGETALLILTPLLVLLLLIMPLVVRILYTPAFLPVVMFANLTILGMQFKAVTWAMDYVFLAKGNSKLYLTIEVISGVFILLLNLLFFYLYGLNGLGISFIITYLFAMIFSYLVLKWKYSFRFPTRFYMSLGINYGFTVVAFLAVFISDSIYRYVAGGLIFIIATLYSLYKLNEFMDLKSYLLGKLKRK